jgi:hypothetical protein
MVMGGGPARVELVADFAFEDLRDLLHRILGCQDVPRKETTSRRWPSRPLARLARPRLGLLPPEPADRPQSRIACSGGGADPGRRPYSITAAAG